MRETILTILALSIVSTMSLGVLSTNIQNQLKQIDREFEVYASGVATEVMDYIASRSFDERSNPDNWKKLGIPDSTDFSAAQVFGSDIPCNLYQPFTDAVICDDIDDAHMDIGVWQTYDFQVDTLGTIPFEVNVRVSYVNSANPYEVLSSNTKTNTKRVVVNVRSVRHHRDNRAGGTLRLERLITFDQMVAEAHAEAALPMCLNTTTMYVNSWHVPIWESQGAASGVCP